MIDLLESNGAVRGKQEYGVCTCSGRYNCFIWGYDDLRGEEPLPCEDLNVKCPGWADKKFNRKVGVCKTPDYMLLKCPKSCGLCSCKDHEDNCQN